MKKLTHKSTRARIKEEGDAMPRSPSPTGFRYADYSAYQPPRLFRKLRTVVPG